MKATLQIFGEISNWGDDFNAEKAMEFFNTHQDADEYEIIINSNGGVVSTGFAIADIIKTQSGGKPVTTIAYSCMSIATIIFLAGTNRLVSPNSEFMIHNPWTGMGFGEAEDFEKIAADLRRIEDKAVNEYLKYANISEEEIRDLMKAESFIDSEKLLEIGFATAILEPVNILQLPKLSEKAVAYHTTKNIGMTKIEERIANLSLKLDKFINPTPKALQIALDDGRTVEVVTEQENAMEGDSIRFEGSALEDGVYNTAETQEAYTVKAGKITAIEDISEQVFNAEEVQEFVMKAGEKTVEAIKKEFEAYAKAEDFTAFQKAQNTEIETLKTQLSEAEAKLQEVQETFQAALKEIKENLVSDFSLNEENPNNVPERQLKAWEVEMEKIRAKTNQ